MSSRRTVRTGRSWPRAGGFLWLGLAVVAACERAEEPPVPRREPIPRVHTPPALEPSAEDGQGRVTISPGDDVVAASWGRWTIEWTAGEDGVAPGGGAVLQVSPFWGWSPPQVGQPGAPGYTTVTTSNPGVPLSVSEGQVPMTVVCRVSEPGLAAGDVIRFVYGDSTAGGPGSLARADRFAEEFEELHVKTDGDGDGRFGSVPDQPTLRILPGPARHLAVAAPAVGSPGAELEVRIHALDVWGSRTSLPPGKGALILRPLRTGDDHGEVAVDTLAVWDLPVEEPGLSRFFHVEDPGLYRLQVHHTAAAGVVKGLNDLLLVQAGGPFRGILWGDIHSHSGLSDGTGSPRDLLSFAREVSGLDVAAVTDHDAHGLRPLAENGGWERVRRATEEAYVPGEFVTILGYEWTSWTWGHRNVYYPGSEGEVFSFRSEESDTPGELWRLIAPYGAMTIPHHPAGGPVPVDWRIPSDEERETVVEICSIHGSSEALGVERGIYRPVSGASVRDAFDQGHRLGILAAGDTHDGHPGRRTQGAVTNGLAAFRASERTREAVFDALWNRRVYGTSGPRVLLHTDWDGSLPGTDLDGIPSGPLTVDVVAPEPVRTVELIDGGGVRASRAGGGRVASFRFMDVEPRGSWIYVRVELADGEAAWESPYWLPERTP